MSTYGNNTTIKQEGFFRSVSMPPGNQTDVYTVPTGSRLEIFHMSRVQNSSVQFTIRNPDDNTVLDLDAYIATNPAWLRESAKIVVPAGHKIYFQHNVGLTSSYKISGVLYSNTP